ncbi:MAG: 4Fe-4S binding protein [Thermoleophilia bacterium]|nr:4Fe-4S binding protein [Thermoleophilia bacterium]
MNNIIINRELCNGCKTCFRACFIDVIKWDDKNKQPIIAYPEECVQCLYCEINCPERALKVVPYYDTYLFPREHLI